jgi:hypothetical protein
MPHTLAINVHRPVVIMPILVVGIIEMTGTSKMSDVMELIF